MTREEKQKAIDALKISAPVMAVTPEEFNDYIQTLNKIMDWLEQEPKTGHWIFVGEENEEETRNGNFRYICSECTYSDVHAKSTEVPYCWHCGAKMVEPQEREVSE